MVQAHGCQVQGQQQQLLQQQQTRWKQSNLQKSLLKLQTKIAIEKLLNKNMTKIPCWYAYIIHA